MNFYRNWCTMKTRLLGSSILAVSVCVFLLALNIGQREIATTCWVTSSLMFIVAAMILVTSTLERSIVTAGDPRRQKN
ncbi:hypothetical protein [Glutamicibacter sp.]|jgi:hypothetical protein|uniref:hypothetical protein n=1 Tax=Glutamicibacter sp. TaxID=1931995 RepID=UPI002B45D243|nr:hypothetical protein [Glutamicibacter sp.]HJX77563.1 hypothetical protein [Glutamicibacter sp.]